MFDVAIIGAGVTGCAVARYLSAYDAKICVIEKEEDVCCGTSKANSAIIHAGYDAKNGSMMAKMNVRGSNMMPELSKELDIPYNQIGSIVLCLEEDGLPNLHALYENGVKNGVKGLKILDSKQLKELEPNVSDDVVAALYAPTGAIVCPFEMTIALAENANLNGVEFFFNNEVLNISYNNDVWNIKTSKQNIQAKVVINASGVYSADLHNKVSNKKYNITARKGEYYLLDKTTIGIVNHTIFTLPTKFGKGILVSPTVHGNVICGPTATDISDKEATNTTLEGLDEIGVKASKMIPKLNTRAVITSFAGLRAHEDGHEFVIKEAEGTNGFIDCLGIESPGLSSAPAVGEYVAYLVCEKLSLKKNNKFNPKRTGIIKPKNLSKEEYNKLIKKNPSYGKIVCRCEQITEGEIIDSIKRPLGAKSLDGIKRRTRAGMGRCQSGFCSPRVMEILSKEANIPMEEITKSGNNSKFIVSKTKGGEN